MLLYATRMLLCTCPIMLGCTGCMLLVCSCVPVPWCWGVLVVCYTSMLLCIPVPWCWDVLAVCWSPLCWGAVCLPGSGLTGWARRTDPHQRPDLQEHTAQLPHNFRNRRKILKTLKIMKICIVTVTRNSTSVHLQYHRTVYSIIVQSTVTQRCQTQESDPAVSFPAMGKARVIEPWNPWRQGKITQVLCDDLWCLFKRMYSVHCTVQYKVVHTVQYSTFVVYGWTLLYRCWVSNQQAVKRWLS